MNQYDDELMQIDFFKLHPTFLPFIGDDYNEYRILHIGESHFLDQSYEDERFGIEYFQKWWTDPSEEVAKFCGDAFNTRGVLSHYASGGKDKSYTIYTNFIKSFSKVVLNNPIESISPQDQGLYRYVAFMNFYQMPSLHLGIKFWKSLEASAEKCGKKELASETWQKAVKESVPVIDRVIDILDPKAIVFTSLSARDAYKASKGKYREDARVIFTSHPAYPYTWWKELRSLEYRRGIDVFEDELKRIYKGK